MAYRLAIKVEPGYTHFRVTGENSVESVRGYLREIGEESARNGYRRVLIEEALEGPRLYSGDVLALIRERGPDARIFERIAYVDTHTGEAAPNMEFAALVAADFGLNVRVFGGLEAARGWLLETASTAGSGLEI